LNAEHKLTRDELSALAKRKTEISDVTEAARVRKAIVGGFYGAERNAFRGRRSA